MDRPASSVDEHRGPQRAGLLWLSRLLLPLFAVSLGYGAVLPVLPSLLQRLDGTGTDQSLPLHAGLLTGVYIGAFVVGAPAWGRLTDTRGSRPVLLTGLIGYAAATVWFGLTSSVALAYAARFAAGICAAGVLPATSAWIVRGASGDERVRQLAWMNAAVGLGFLAGPAVTGWAHTLLAGTAQGLVPAAHLTAVPIWLTAAVALVAALSVAHSAELPGPALETRVRLPSVSARMPQHLRLLAGLAALGLGVFEVALSLEGVRFRGWSASALANLFAVCSLVMLVVQLGVFAPFARRFDPRVLATGGFLGMAAGLALLPAVSLYGAVAMLVALVALGSGVLQPTLSVAVAESAGAQVGRAMGLQSAAGNLGQAAGSVAAGWLFGVRPELPFAATAAFLFVTALSLVWSVR